MTLRQSWSSTLSRLIGPAPARVFGGVAVPSVVAASCAVAVGVVGAAVGCSPLEAPAAEWPPQALQWYERASSSFRTLDTVDAELSIGKALAMQPDRAEVKTLAGDIALSQLDYAAALERVRGLESSEARALRGRALWYSGQIAEAAEELDALLADPNVRDPWAAGVVKLARTGRGRTPFAKSGSMVAVLEMNRYANTAMVVPVELNGQPVLALISTGSTEVVVDAVGDQEPSWVNLRFQERIEVQDVPALTQDLAGISQELNAPIKVMLGTNLLRHLNVTVDFRGRQFVVRNYEPPAPPAATTLKVHYIRGGGMVLQSQLGEPADPAPFAFFVDTGSPYYSLVLDEPAWARTKLAAQRKPFAGTSGITQARIPKLQLGGYGVTDVSALGGVPKVAEVEKALGVDLDGLLGSGILSEFRVTLADSGRTMWLEDMPEVQATPAAGALPTTPAPALPNPG